MHGLARTPAALVACACATALSLAGVTGGVARASSWLAVAPDAQSGSQQVTPVDLGSDLALAALTTTGATSHLGVGISPDGRTAYVVSAGSHELVPIDLTTDPATVGTPVDLTGVPAPPNTRVPAYIAISPDGSTAYVSDAPNDQVVVVHLNTSPVTLGAIDLPAGSKPHGIAFAPDGATAYVADYGTGHVSQIDVATASVQTAISGVGVHPDQIAVTPDGTSAYVTDNGSSDVYPISLPSGTVGSAISVGAGLVPLGIAISPDGSTAWTANFGTESNGSGAGDTVTPITLSSDTAGTPITVGGGPWSVAVTPDSRTVYVGNSNDGTITPINAATDTAGSPITGVPFPRSLAITPDQPPVASFTVTSAAPGQATRFDASESTVAFGSIASYTWSFGDGSPAVTTTGPTVSHVYTGAGSYTATVTETSSAGTSVSGEVYTGQTASSVGGSSALATRTVIVSNAPQPAVTLSASSLWFGIVGVGKTAGTQTVTVTDSGAAPLSVSTVTLGGTGAGAFRRSSDTCSGQTIAPGASCAAAVVFAPTASGAVSATLAFTDNASGSPHTIALSGAGTSTGTLTGLVSDARGPAVGVQVQICPRAAGGGIQLGGSGCRYTTTGMSGGYEVGGLTPGSWAMQVEPSTGALFGSSAIVQIQAGAQTQDFTLRAPVVLHGGASFDTPSGTVTNGVPVVNWNAPFSSSFPLAIAPTGPPNTSELYVVSAAIGPDTGGGVGSGGAAIGGAALFEVRYDAGGKPWAISNVIEGPVDLAPTGPGSQPMARAASGGSCTINAGPIKVVIQTTDNGEGKTGTQISVQNQTLTGDLNTSSFTLPQPVSLPAPSTGQVVSGNGPADIFVDTVSKGASAIGPPGAYNDTVNGLNTAANILTDPGQIGNWVDGAGKVIMKWGPLDEALHGMTGYISDISKGFVNPNGGGDCKPPPPCKVKHAVRLPLRHGAQADGCPPPPPPPPPQPAPNSGGLYIDPSGTVHTRGGHPIADARVVLLRARSPHARFRPVPRGSAIMSPVNRRNPDLSDALGYFGWDVTPGYYRVRASHRGCVTASTRILRVPPPAVGLSLALACTRLRFARSSVRLRVAGERTVGRAHTLILKATVAGRRRRGRPVGIVTLRADSRALGQTVLDARSGTATLIVVVTGRPKLRALYSGDGTYAASRSAPIRPRR